MDEEVKLVDMDVDEVAKPLFRPVSQGAISVLQAKSVLKRFGMAEEALPSGPNLVGDLDELLVDFLTEARVTTDAEAKAWVNRVLFPRKEGILSSRGVMGHGPLDVEEEELSLVAQAKGSIQIKPPMAVEIDKAKLPGRALVEEQAVYDRTAQLYLQALQDLIAKGALNGRTDKSASFRKAQYDDVLERYNLWLNTAKGPGGPVFDTAANPVPSFKANWSDPADFAKAQGAEAVPDTRESMLEHLHLLTVDGSWLNVPATFTKDLPGLAKRTPVFPEGVALLGKVKPDEASLKGLKTRASAQSSAIVKVLEQHVPVQTELLGLAHANCLFTLQELVFMEESVSETLGELPPAAERNVTITSDASDGSSLKVVVLEDGVEYDAVTVLQAEVDAMHQKVVELSQQLSYAKQVCSQSIASVLAAKELVARAGHDVVRGQTRLLLAASAKDVKAAEVVLKGSGPTQEKHAGQQMMLAVAAQVDSANRQSAQMNDLVGASSSSSSADLKRGGSEGWERSPPKRQRRGGFRGRGGSHFQGGGREKSSSGGGRERSSSGRGRGRGGKL